MNQRNQIAKIYQQKQKNNKLYSEVRVACIAAMYTSLLDGKSLKRRIARIVGSNDDDAAIIVIVTMIMALYWRLRKQKLVYSNNYAEEIERSHILEESHSAAFKTQRKQIGEEKQAFIMSDIQANRLNDKWFYLCSSHTDSAEDHKPWQGKVYIDENCDDEKCLALAREYHMKTYQWVIAEPVWMVTRPNCRHYFKSLTYKEVKGKSYDDLVKEHNMHREIGDRPIMQTLKGGQDVEIVIKSYEERLKMHLAMYRVRPNEFLKSAINKDKLLLKKWKKNI